MRGSSQADKGHNKAHTLALELPGVGGIPALPIRELKYTAWQSTLALFLTITLWFVYLFVTSVLLLYSIPMALLMIALVGQYLATWLGYMRHELWHNYFPGVKDELFFRWVSYLLLSDPKIYEIAHVTHHRDLHTSRDIEFFCENYSTNRKRRKIQFIFELIFGNAAWEIFTWYRLIRSHQLSIKHSLRTVAIRLGIIFVCCLAADMLYPEAGDVLAIVYFLTVWLGAVITRHDQWVEHLGIVSDAPLAERIRMVRNLPNIHWTNALWNVLNHNDPKDHYFHHAYPQINFREVSNLKLPGELPVLTIPQYFRLLWQHYKSI